MILGIFGAGGLGGDIYQLAQELNQKNERWEELIFIDDITNKKIVHNTTILRFKEFQQRYNNKEAEIIVASGEPFGRKNIYETVKNNGCRLATIVHPATYNPSNLEFEEGVIIRWGAYLSRSNLKIGRNIIIMSHVSLAHDSSIGDHSVLATAAVISGKCRIGKCCYIGTNASIREGIVIGDNSIVGMGAVVVKNVTENSVVVGNPARKIRENNKRIVFD